MFILVLSVAGLSCLTPLTLYLLWLAAINGRRRPTVVSGVWDFVALLAGLSGFLLFGGGLVLALLQSKGWLMFYGVRWDELNRAWQKERLAWALFGLGYVLVVGGLAAYALLARQRTLVVYNVDRADAEAAVADVLEKVGLSPVRAGGVWSDGRGLVELDDFPGLRNVTLRLLPADPRLCEEIERGLREALPAADSDGNPAAFWVLVAAGAGVLGILSSVVLICAFLYGGR